MDLEMIQEIFDDPKSISFGSVCQSHISYVFLMGRQPKSRLQDPPLFICIPCKIETIPHGPAGPARA